MARKTRIEFPVVGTDENGSDVAGVQNWYFDMNGRVTWFMNTRGAITYRAFDASTGALIQQIDDVNTALMTDVPAGWATQAGWGLHLISDFITDALGRVTQARGPWHDVQLHGKDTEATPSGASPSRLTWMRRMKPTRPWAT
jgi:hypothetical protein